MHYNIYYLFLEDKLRHPLPEDKKVQIWKYIEKVYKQIKPP